jgi:hypothetical protein
VKDSFNLEYLKINYPNHNINISKNSQVGEGIFGKIFKLVVGIRNKKSNFTKLNNYIIKDFKLKNATDSVNNNIFIWEFFKKNKFPTFNTFKKYNDKSIIMEDLTLPNNFCISPSNQHKNNIDQNKFLMKYHVSEKPLEIENFEKIVNQMFLYCIRLKRLKCVINNCDVFFYVINKEEPYNIKILLGDFDNILLDEEDFENNNLKYFKDSVHMFIYFYISSPKKRERYYELLENIFNQILIFENNNE